MRRKAEIRKPGIVLRIVNVPEVKEQQAEIRFDGAIPFTEKYESSILYLVNWVKGLASKKATV